jgi:predicted RNase H-like HicB family nuclease
LIVVEKAGSNYSAYAPDLPGCVATGKTVAETETNMHIALQMHIQGILDDNLPVPEQYAVAEYMAV